MSKPDLKAIRKRAEHEVAEEDTPGGIAHFGTKKFFEGSIYNDEVGPVLKKRIKDFVHQSIMHSHTLEGLRQLRQDLKDVVTFADNLETTLVEARRILGRLVREHPGGFISTRQMVERLERIDNTLAGLSPDGTEITVERR